MYARTHTHEPCWHFRLHEILIISTNYTRHVLSTYIIQYIQSTPRFDSNLPAMSVDTSISIFSPRPAPVSALNPTRKVVPGRS